MTIEFFRAADILNDALGATLTMSQGESCEVCERRIPEGETCVAIPIGGGWTEACRECVIAHAADIAAESAL